LGASCRLPDRIRVIARRGMAFVVEGRRRFAQMTVTENLELGGWLMNRAERARRLELAFKDFPRLRECSQQMVAVARAMMSAGKTASADVGRPSVSP